VRNLVQEKQGAQQLMADYKYVDADNHFYEAPDAFSRHGNKRVKNFVQWFDQGKRKRLLLGGEFAPGTGNPTFNPVAKPGAFHESLKALERGEEPEGPRYGALVPLDRAFMYRDERIEAMKGQNLERTFIFPTIGYSIEHMLVDDWDMLYDLFHAFNAWMNEDWGFNYQDTIHAPVYVPMADIGRAVAELEWGIENGARIWTTQPGPWYGRSPADSYFDPVWELANENNLGLVFHAYGGIPAAYKDFYTKEWAKPPVTNMGHSMMLRSAILPYHRPVMDSMMAMTLGGLFNRFPNVKAASIEVGAAWVEYCLHELDHAGSNLVERRVTTFDGELVGRPSDVFRQHCYVAPFPEEDVARLAGAIGSNRVLFGSDWPHPEGIANPAGFHEFVTPLPEDEQRLVMRDNALEFAGVV
jgi:predicted TIM-barrel fold metal-dependent hydrolase